MNAAGHALRWARHLCPPRTAEPAAWRSLEELFDRLDAGAEPKPHLAVFGLRLLTDMGYALELDGCVKCGRACPPGRSAFVDGERGGLVCMSCGGARRTIKADLRALAAAAQRGSPVTLTRDDASELIDIVEASMAAHSGFDPL